MNKPPFWKQVLFGLARKGWAYDTHEEITQTLADETHRQRRENLPAHTAGAKNIDQQLGFQPGLVTAHSETHDQAIYLEALAARARELGQHTLAHRLSTAAKATHEANWQIGQAAHATIPGAQVPASSPS
ncbi:hypothetical protein [Streptomyces sp. NPDC054842]